MGILQARILEWGAIPFSRGSSRPRIKPRSPALQADSLLSEPPEKPSIHLSLFEFSFQRLEEREVGLCNLVHFQTWQFSTPFDSRGNLISHGQVSHIPALPNPRFYAVN